MKIWFDFSDKTEFLEVELIDNPAIKSWTEKFYPKYHVGATVQVQNDYSLHWTWDESLLQEYIDILKNRISSLGRYGYNYIEKIPDTPIEINRAWTNSLHRFFTHSQKEINNKIMLDMTAEEIYFWKKSVSDLLHDINEYVHRIERYIPGQISCEVPMYEICLIDDAKYDIPKWWHMPLEYRQYHSKQHADVIFGPQILGKSLIRSYFDDDDPNDWDTTGHYNNGGCLLILPSDARQQIYESHHFKKWLTDHGIVPDQAIYDFPVGNIINQNKIKPILDKILTVGSPIPTRYVF